MRVSQGKCRQAPLGSAMRGIRPNPFIARLHRHVMEVDTHFVRRSPMKTNHPLLAPAAAPSLQATSSAAPTSAVPGGRSLVCPAAVSAVTAQGRGRFVDLSVPGSVRRYRAPIAPAAMRSAIALLLALFAALPASAGVRPIDGRWSGGPATCSTPFSIQGSSYAAPGGRPQRIRKIEPSGGWWRVELADGSVFVLMDVKPNSMTWHSPASSDTFELRRCS